MRRAIGCFFLVTIYLAAQPDALFTLMKTAPKQARTFFEKQAQTHFEGTATALTDEGFLVVDTRVVSAGDVVHLRYR